MRSEQFDDQLAAFASTKAWLMGVREAPVSASELTSFEAIAGYRLPKEYSRVAQTLGAGEFGFAVVYSIRDGEWGLGTRVANADLPADFVPISDNGCGDFYGFLVKDGVCGSDVYFAAHEAGYALKRTRFADLYEYLCRYGFNPA